MRHLQHMRWALLLSALLTITPLAAFAAASDGWHRNDAGCEGTADTSVPNLDPEKLGSWCPITTTTKIIKVSAIADCNWYTTGGETLSIDQCSSPSSTYCTTPLVDADGVAWVVTSADDSGRFSLASGYYEITASAAAATGRLVCTGRQ